MRLDELDAVNPLAAKKNPLSPLVTSEGRDYRVWVFANGEFATVYPARLKPDAFSGVNKAIMAAHPECKAIVLAGRSTTLLLISVNGTLLPRPEVLEHKSPNQNLNNDWALLDRMTELTVKPREIEPFTGWVSGTKQRVIPTQNPIELLDKAPDYFGVTNPNLGRPERRIIAERNGWCIAQARQVGERMIFHVSGPDEERVSAASVHLARVLRVPSRNVLVVAKMNTGEKSFPLADAFHYL